MIEKTFITAKQNPLIMAEIISLFRDSLKSGDAQSKQYC